MIHPENGDVRVILGGEPCTIRFGWRAIRALKDEFGDRFDEKLAEASLDLDVQTLAKILVIGLEHHHPDQFSEERIMELSPPLVEITGAIHKAAKLAFYGDGEVTENPTLAKRVRLAWKILFAPPEEWPIDMA